MNFTFLRERAVSMITVKHLTKSYGNHVVFKDVHFEIPNGKIAFVMGENGAGKTTLLKCLLNLESYRGEIRYDGKPLQDVRRDVHILYDDVPLYLNLSGYKNIELLLARPVKTEQIKETAHAFLPDEVLKAKVKTYSYGQKKKLGLILAVLSKPKYLFLDEASNGLDYDTMEDFRKTLLNWAKQMTIIATGHQFEFYAPIIDELFILKEKSLIHLKRFKEEGGDLIEAYKNYIK